MRVITLNVNGLRSAARKGLLDWLPTSGADIVCLQETRLSDAQRAELSLGRTGYVGHYADALRPGYAGTAILARSEPDEVERGWGEPEFDREGRLIAARFGALWVISLYLPSGSLGPERQASKDRFLQAFPQVLARLRVRGPLILAGDFNIAHRPIDLRNAKANEKHSGFLPHERAWLDWLFSPDGGLVDAFREVNQEKDQYTYWSNRGRAYEKNVGWRIDYEAVTPDLARTVQGASIYKEQRFSDHAPLVLDYEGVSLK
ncbi:MAG: exodeoxyribonuclease III [Gammaproteobacteria bacterium]